ncbi:hypothetical protein SCA6_006598 [Theobroma cacao]
MIALAPICLPFTPTKTKSSFLLNFSFSLFAIGSPFSSNTDRHSLSVPIINFALYPSTPLPLLTLSSPLNFATSMASRAIKSTTAKQLKEHLQEQQEPFTLSIYLSERGYLVKCLSSNGRNGCCQINLFKNLSRPRSYNLNKKMVLISTRIVKSILYKLVSSNDIQEPSCRSDKAHQDEFQTAETNGSTEVKALTPFGAFPSCAPEEEPLPLKHCRTPQASNVGYVEQQKTLTDKTCQRKCTQEKHLNLMSMLNTLSSDKVHHIITRQESLSSRSSTLTENAGGNFMFTTFPWKWLGKSLIERYSLIGFKESKEIIEPCSPQHRRSKELVNRRKPLFNLTGEREPIQNNDRKNVRNKYNYIHWFIGVGNPIKAEQIYSCTKYSRDSSMDFSNTLEEWNYSRQMQRKIGFELGDTIMDEIIEEIIYLLRQ